MSDIQHNNFKLYNLKDNEVDIEKFKNDLSKWSKKIVRVLEDYQNFLGENELPNCNGRMLEHIKAMFMLYKDDYYMGREDNAKCLTVLIDKLRI